MVETLATGAFRLTSIQASAALGRAVQVNGKITHEINPNLVEWFEQQGWKENVDWRWQWVSDPVFYFTNTNKAMLFKLAWGGVVSEY